VPTHFGRAFICLQTLKKKEMRDLKIVARYATTTDLSTSNYYTTALDKPKTSYDVMSFKPTLEYKIKDIASRINNMTNLKVYETNVETGVTKRTKLLIQKAVIKPCKKALEIIAVKSYKPGARTMTFHLNDKNVIDYVNVMSNQVILKY